MVEALLLLLLSKVEVTVVFELELLPAPGWRAGRERNGEEGLVERKRIDS